MIQNIRIAYIHGKATVIRVYMTTAYETCDPIPYISVSSLAPVSPFLILPIWIVCYIFFFELTQFLNGISAILYH